MPFDNKVSLVRGVWTLVTVNNASEVTIQTTEEKIQVKGTTGTTAPAVDSIGYTIPRGDAVIIKMSDISKGIAAQRLWAVSDVDQDIYVTHN